MKRIIVLLAVYLLACTARAQQQLHIHHINIGNGDATLIGIYDSAEHKYTSKVLIDGGQLKAELRLLPYIRKMVGEDEESFHFNYVILTHYHDDHYKGLLALQDGRLTADSIIDPGGYRVSSYFRHSATVGTVPDSLKLAMPWLTAIKTAARHLPDPYVKGRSTVLLRFGSTGRTGIDGSVRIGMIGDTPVELHCIAGWGNTLTDHGGIKPNPKPKKTNGNNYTLAFVLSCGEFRYFIGGDMGGTSSGQYIDQESAVTAYLNDAYPQSHAMTGDEEIAGHVCGFKANHHGSDHSNNAAFMEGMHPAITVTSAGDKNQWHLPHPEYLKRLAKVEPLSVSDHLTGDRYNRGVYFTNLYNFTNYPSKTKANTLFRNKPGISYNYGNNSPTASGSYLIIVNEGNEGKSIFEAGRVDITGTVPYQRLAVFNCHRQ